MISAAEALNDFFNKELPKLEETFDWKIPSIEGFDLSGQSSYVANVALKKFFNRQWLHSESRPQLARVVIAGWGRVRGNSDETFERYVCEAQKAEPSLPIKGVASYSKLLAITDLDKFAIYDARVAACLNALQINRQITHGIAFHYLPGRNTVLMGGRRSTSHPGFCKLPEFAPAALSQRGWSLVAPDDCYRTYLDILKACLEVLPSKYRLYDLEMALFSSAVRECKMAIKDRMSGVFYKSRVIG